MMNDCVKDHRLRKMNDYPNTMKKSIPISIVNGKDTIFIKTKPNKLTYNYLNNGNQIKNYRNLTNEIAVNQSSEFNNSLKNTFSIQKSKFIKSANGTILEGSNLNSSKLNDLIKIKHLPNNSNLYRGTNSFIKISRKNNDIINRNKNSGINTNNVNSNHTFNFYNYMKVNNSSIKKSNKLEKNKENINKNVRKKNNYTYIAEKEKNHSKGKRQNTSMNRAINSRKYIYTNNLSNINYNKDINSFRIVNNYFVDKKEINKSNNNLGEQLYYPYNKYNIEIRGKKNNHTYYNSLEKKKEKSLAEKRLIAKKPISYLIKNINQKIKNKNVKNSLIINVNNINNKKTNNDYFRERDKTNNTINYKRRYCDINNYNNNRYEKFKNYETDNKIKIKKSDNITFQTTSNKDKKIIYNKKENALRNNTFENNVVNNNTYYNINNTFIFDNSSNELFQNDLTKFLPNIKNNNSMYINNNTNINNYNTNFPRNNYKVNIELDKIKNKAIKKINDKIKSETITINKVNNLNKNSTNDDYIKIVLNNNNTDNKVFNIQKFSSKRLSQIVKNKNNHSNYNYNHDHIKIITDIDKLYNDNSFNTITNKSRRNYNNNFNIVDNTSKDFVIKEYNNKKKKETDNNKTLIKNKKEDNNFAKKNKINEQKKLDKGEKKENENKTSSIKINVLNRRKSHNMRNLEKKVKLDKFSIKSLIKKSLKNTAINSIKKERKKSSKLKKKEKEKDKSKEKMKEKELLEYKLMNIKNKSINIVNNSQKLKDQKLKIIKKGNKTNKNNNLQIKEIIEEKKENQNLIITHENISIQTFDNDETNSNERSIKEEEKEKKKEKHYNSFEFVSLSENKINENLFYEDDINDDNELFANENFDDINTIIRKIDFYSVSLRNNPNDIFNTNDNNELYINYETKFDKKFDKFVKKN